MIYFIADTHFGHENIIRLCERPFKSIAEMDSYMVSAWNAKVKDEDTVYILGDFAFRSQEPQRYGRACRGHKILIKGNHDIKNMKNNSFTSCFEAMYDMLDIVIGNERFIMCHYPIAEWSGYYHHAWHIYGHIHNKTDIPAYEYMKKEPYALNAGADIIQFAPATFEELKAFNKAFKETH